MSNQFIMIDGAIIGCNAVCDTTLEPITGKNAIVPKKTGVAIGQRQKMSPLDIQGIKEYYDC